MKPPKPSSPRKRKWLPRIAHLGGYARAKKLSPKRRKEISDMGIRARWGRRKVAGAGAGYPVPADPGAYDRALEKVERQIARDAMLI